MYAKLTLSIEQSVVEKAKIYAMKKERSLSDLIENYLKALIEKDSDKSVDDEVSPTITALRGSFAMPKDFDYKKELTSALSEKYLK